MGTSRDYSHIGQQPHRQQWSKEPLQQLCFSYSPLLALFLTWKRSIVVLWYGHLQCSWEKTRWYVLYRSVEGSQVSKDARCINGLQVAPLVNDETRIRFQYTPGGEKYASFHFKSSTPGGPKNIIEIKPEHKGSKAVAFNVLYSECESCHVLKHVTADNKTTCVQYVPAEALDKEIPQCHFAYDAECGHLPKYHASDKSCLSKTG